MDVLGKSTQLNKLIFFIGYLIMSHISKLPRCQAAWKQISPHLMNGKASPNIDLGIRLTADEMLALECQAIVSGRSLILIHEAPNTVVQLK